MMRNFLRACLDGAASEGRLVVAVGEKGLSGADAEVLREFGFISCCELWAKLALRTIGELEHVARIISELDVPPEFYEAKQAAAGSLAVGLQLKEPTASAVVERQLWPAKITGTGIPTFIVSIRPEWAQHFFDVELGAQLLIGLREDLHLGVEGVYYRSSENNNLTAPGRVLWYVSKGARPLATR